MNGETLEKEHSERFLDPNPIISPESLSSTSIDEPFMWLAARSIDSITIDGHRLVSVDQAERLHDETMHVVCSGEDGSSHLFVYNPTTDEPVQHYLTKKH